MSTIPKAVAAEVRKRDGAFCRGCGIPQSVNRNQIRGGSGHRFVEVPFDLHHVWDPTKNTTDNLISVCKYCHRLLHKFKKTDADTYARSIARILDGARILTSRYCVTCLRVLAV